MNPNFKGLRRPCESGDEFYLAKDNRLENALYLWLILKRGKGNPVSGPLLTEEEAAEFHEQAEQAGSGGFVSDMAFMSFLFNFMVSRCLQIIMPQSLSRRR